MVVGGRRFTMSISTRRREERLEVRLTTTAKRLLQRAASVREQSISAFMLDSCMAAAAETLADRREFRIPAKAYDAFVAALDAPAKPKARLDKLLHAPSVLV
jgi:uncharacterized protein (DUF1778 family)